MNNKDKEQWNALFQELVSHEAYKYVKKYFDERALLPMPPGTPLEVLAQRYTADSSIAMVFAFCEDAAVISPEHGLDPEAEAQLLPDVLDDDALDILDQPE